MHLKHHTGTRHNTLIPLSRTDWVFYPALNLTIYQQNSCKTDLDCVKCQKYTQYKEPTFPEGSFKTLPQICLKDVNSVEALLSNPVPI